MKRIINGVEEDLTEVQIAHWSDDQMSMLTGGVAKAAPLPALFAAVAIGIADGAISVIELAAQLSSATYEDGWVMVGFSETQSSAEYLIFAQTDVPAKVEQFKSDGYFELVFSDPVSGDPLNPGRIDIQILKVR